MPLMTNNSYFKPLTERAVYSHSWACLIVHNFHNPKNRFIICHLPHSTPKYGAIAIFVCVFDCPSHFKSYFCHFVAFMPRKYSVWAWCLALQSTTLAAFLTILYSFLVLPISYHLSPISSISLTGLLNASFHHKVYSWRTRSPFFAINIIWPCD